MYLIVVLVDNNLEISFNWLLVGLIFASVNADREWTINSSMNV